jgi:hypothetical protein
MASGFTSTHGLAMGNGEAEFAAPMAPGKMPNTVYLAPLVV